MHCSVYYHVTQEDAMSAPIDFRLYIAADRLAYAKLYPVSHIPIASTTDVSTPMDVRLANALIHALRKFARNPMNSVTSMTT